MQAVGCGRARSHGAVFSCRGVPPSGPVAELGRAFRMGPIASGATRSDRQSEVKCHDGLRHGSHRTAAHKCSSMVHRGASRALSPRRFREEPLARARPDLRPAPARRCPRRTGRLRTWRGSENLRVGQCSAARVVPLRVARPHERAHACARDCAQGAAFLARLVIPLVHREEKAREHGRRRRRGRGREQRAHEARFQWACGAPCSAASR